uniref:Transcription factor grauzone n=1 Tax=Anopheles dirus TaxID=7168 RepID=A0A182NHS8_9DIPT
MFLLELVQNFCTLHCRNERNNSLIRIGVSQRSTSTKDLILLNLCNTMETAAVAVARKCTTCFCTNAPDYLSIFDDENTRKDIALIVAKHLWFEVTPVDGESQWICTRCWIALEAFHSFYLEIEQSRHQQTHLLAPGNKDDRSATPPSGNNTGPAYSTEFLEIKGEPVDDEEEDEDKEQDECGSLSDRIIPDDEIKSEEESPDESASESDASSRVVKRRKGRRVRAGGRKDDAAAGDDEGKRLAKRKAGGRFLSPPEEDQQIREFYKRIVCEVCDNKRMMVGEPLIEYRTWGELLRHTKEQHGHYKIFVQCPVCEMKLRTKVTLVQHMDMHLHPDKYRCAVCGEVYQNMKEHMQNKHEERQFSCDLCSSRFPFKKRLVVHMKKMHAEKNVTCDQCQKSFTRYTIEDHRRSVHMARFVCEHCPKTFKIRFRLQKHMQEHDKSLRVSTCVPCPTCGQVMGDKYILRQHIRHMHAEQQAVDCGTCGKTFKNNRNLKVHLANVCMKPVQLHPCAICGKAFRHKNKLKDHMASCTPN